MAQLLEGLFEDAFKLVLGRRRDTFFLLMALISGERGQTTPINLILQTDCRLKIIKIVEMENNQPQTFY